MRIHHSIASRVSRALCCSWLLCFAACADDEPAERAANSASSAGQGAQAAPDAADDKPTLTQGDDDVYSFRTEPATVEPGQERYLCYTQTLDQDLVIDKYEHEAQSYVHHIVFVRTLAPEPDGFSECDTLFRTTWDPLFITGAGRSTLEFPENAGHTLKQGTQLLVQLHLLNSGTKAVSEPVEIKMHRSNVDNPIPIGTYTFGTLKLTVPANQASTVEAGCEMTEDVQLVAAFPHMHRMGRSLRFEAGHSDDAMQTEFVRDPYDFDDQHLEQLDIKLAAGDKTRVTCEYENTTASDVTFGESTSNEMCFFIGFALNRSQIAGCVR